MLSAWFINPVSAANIYVRDFSPQGEVREPDRATAVFSADVVKLGETNASAPYIVNCPVSGISRWSSPNTWTYTLERKLNVGENAVLCSSPSLRAKKAPGLAAVTVSIFLRRVRGSPLFSRPGMRGLKKIRRF